MTSILKTINQISFRKILSIGFLLAISLSIPVTLVLVNQQTRLSSSAKIQKPPVISVPKTAYGPPAQSPIEVTRVYPFLGKVGDELVILGKNFGTNPANRSLTINGVAVSPENTDVWQDNMITVFIPENVQSGLIQIRSGNFSWTSKTPFIIYSQLTPTQIKKNGNTIIVVSPITNLRRITYSMVNGSITEIKANPDPNGTFTFTVPSGEVNHLALYDNNGTLIPFYVNPIEFDF